MPKKIAICQSDILRVLKSQNQATTADAAFGHIINVKPELATLNRYCTITTFIQKFMFNVSNFLYDLLETRKRN